MTPTKPPYKNPYGNVYGSMVVTPVGRLAMPHLSNPSTKFKPSFQAIILFDTKDAQTMNGLKVTLAEIPTLMREKFGAVDHPVEHEALRDGNEKQYQGFSGCVYISAKSDTDHKPRIVGPDRKNIDPAMLQAGMKVIFVVTPQVFDQNGGGVSWQLNTVQLVEDDGIRYYGGPDPLSLLAALTPEIEGSSTGVSAAPATPEAAPAIVAPDTRRPVAGRGKLAALNNL